MLNNIFYSLSRSHSNEGEILDVYRLTYFKIYYKKCLKIVNLLIVNNGLQSNQHNYECSNCSLKKIREFTVPTQVNSASLHPDKTIFVCGGEDLKMYKFDYTTGTEIGK